jgi:hypothetical protein
VIRGHVTVRGVLFHQFGNLRCDQLLHLKRQLSSVPVNAKGDFVMRPAPGDYEVEVNAWPDGIEKNKESVKQSVTVVGFPRRSPWCSTRDEA